MAKAWIGLALWLLGTAAAAGTLDDVRARDQLSCGVNPSLEGFSRRDASGEWQGFDVAMCKALAAAVLGDASKVRYVPVPQESRFDALIAGEVDLLVRNTAWTFTHDAGLPLEFVGVNYYDSQGLLVRKESVTSIKELDGKTICVTADATALADYFATNMMSFVPFGLDLNTSGAAPYLGGGCTALMGEISSLAATRAGFPDPENHLILPDIISKEPFGPVVRQKDGQWADIVRWTLNALIAAEEYGVTSANVEELAATQNTAQVGRLLGAEGDFGAMLGLDPAWAKRAIAASGNYGEIFAAHLGEQTKVGLPRGLNAPWKEGGLLYAPPFR